MRLSLAGCQDSQDSPTAWLLLLKRSTYVLPATPINYLLLSLERVDRSDHLVTSHFKKSRDFNF